MQGKVGQFDRDLVELSEKDEKREGCCFCAEAELFETIYYIVTYAPSERACHELRSTGAQLNVTNHIVT